MSRLLSALLLAASLALGAGAPAPALAQLSATQTWVPLAGGTANALTAAVHNVNSNADLVGVPIRVVVNLANTTTATLQVVGDSGNLTARPIQKMTATGPVALSGGELIPGNTVEFVYNGSVYLVTTPAPIINPTANSVIGITTSGTYIPSVGVRRVYIQAWGGGGGGRSVGNNSHCAGGGGGGSEARQGVFSVTPAGFSITIGTGGPANGDGTDTVIGSTLMRVKGGTGAHTPCAGNGNPGGPGGTGGTGGFGFDGGSGGSGYTTGGGANDNLSGNGGASVGGGSTQVQGGTTPPPNGNFPGGGGVGGNGGPVGNTGGSGADGLVVIQELAN